MSEVDVYELLNNNESEKLEKLHEEGKLDFSKSDDKKGRLKILGYCVAHAGLEVSLATLLRILSKYYDEEKRTEILNEKNDTGIFKTYTPLHLAVAYGHLEALKLLADRQEVDFQAKTADKQNALHCIYEACHRVDPATSISILKLLLEKRVKVTAKMLRKRTVPMIYASKEASELLFYLLNHFKSNKKVLDQLLNEQDEFGDTVLHHACKSQIQRLFKYRFNEYAHATYETIYVIALFDVDTTIPNMEEDLALDIVYFQFADLVDFVHEFRDFFVQHFPSLHSLLAAAIDSRFNEYFNIVSLDKFQHLRSSWLSELEEQEKSCESRGACPVLNTSSTEPIKSRRWLKIQEAKSSSSEEGDESESEDEEEEELDEPKKKSTKAKAGILEAENSDVAKFTTGKCPFGFTSESGVPNPHLQHIAPSPAASTPPAPAATPIPTPAATPTPAVSKEIKISSPVPKPENLAAQIPAPVIRSIIDEEARKIIKTKEKTFADEIKLEVQSIRFWFYAFFWLLSIWITKEICTWSC